ncbi:MAG: hypothetical protein M1827_007007 [Pycnora praestabilis]|nr:MAG: hypothetical protein M1827_007007 [Pycnora praestabilis]
MQNRIDRLEGLVLSLMTNGAQSAGPTAAAAALSASASTGSAEYPHDLDDDDMIKEEQEDEDSETDQVAKSFGVMKVDNNRSMYMGDAHWGSILGDVSGLTHTIHQIYTQWAKLIKTSKQDSGEHKKQFNEQALKVNASKQSDENPGPAFLFGASKPPDKSEILASIPTRPVVDQLVSRYFNSYDPAIHILHGPTFQSQYEQHWAEPDTTQSIWLGLLFSIMCLGMISYQRAGDEPPEYRGRTQELSSTYRTRTAQCLVIADFTKPEKHMVETLILHLQGEYARCRDTEVSVWVMAGMIVRLAMRMGYHRDPAPYPAISPFDGEMRRRTWTFVRQMDLLFSFQIGLPSMIRSRDCDTALPGNLYDDEFGEHTRELPSARPSTEPTPVSYMITKARLAFSFSNIVEQVHSISLCTYEEVMKLDNHLREIRASMPPHLRMRSMEESMTDPANLIMSRFNLDLLYNKGQCVLHRKFLARARENPRYVHSRRTCVDASMELLRHQATLHYESRTTGRLRSVKWFISSLTTHDFLLAAMIVCLDLTYGAEAEGAGRSSGDVYTWGLERRGDMMQSLETSRNIWKEFQDHSMEAYKAYKVLTVMLDKLRSSPLSSNQGGWPVQSAYLHSGGMSNGADAVSAFSVDDGKPEHSAAMTLGMLSGGLTPNSAALFDRTFPATASGNVNMGEAPNGQTQQFSLDQGPGVTGTAGGSPFSGFGVNGGLMDMPPTNLDWDAWDSYIQGTSLDPANQIWPTSMDIPIGTSADGHSEIQQNPNAFAGGGGVFMGVSTPEGNATM